MNVVFLSIATDIKIRLPRRFLMMMYYENDFS